MKGQLTFDAFTEQSDTAPGLSDSLVIRKEVVYSKMMLADAGISSAEIAIHTAAEFQHELEDLLNEYRSEMKG